MTSKVLGFEDDGLPQGEAMSRPRVTATRKESTWIDQM